MIYEIQHFLQDTEEITFNLTMEEPNEMWAAH